MTLRLRHLCRGLLLAAVLVVALSLWRYSRPHVGAGYAVLDTAVYADPGRGALPVGAIVRLAAGAPARPPNIVIILADDLGYGDLGAYGNTGIRTPHVDALAHDGARFTDFYAAASTCSPARAGLLTGRYPLRTGITFPIQPAGDNLARKLNRRIGSVFAALGVTDLVQGGESAVPGLPASEITLPEALKIAGYGTGMVGKWHLGDFRGDPQYHPHRHGFDFFAGFPSTNDEFPYQYWKNDTVVDPDIGLRQGHLTAAITREAVAFIDAHQTKPFFLYLAHKNPHIPLVAAADFDGRSPMGPYGDAVEELDWSVGEVVDALRTRDLLDNTLVIFTSDNGPWHLGNPGRLRGRKGQPLEGGQRVPLIAHWPGRVPAGRTVDTPLMHIDLFPTLLAIAGVEPPADRIVDGRDFRDVLHGVATASPHGALFFFNANVIDGARGGAWKYYRWVSLYTAPLPLDKIDTLAGRAARRYTYTDPRTGQTAPLLTHMPLLFNLGLDPNESYNVVDRHPADAARLHAAIESWERDFFANPRGWR
ncbi:sulfatase [Candidatus Binatia bacterium]|nr:sulfatase [Candidatus Binatia bacterium]